MKKFLRFLVISAMLLNLTSLVSAENGSLTISGTESTTANSFAFIDVSLNGEDISNAHGTVTYNPAEMGVFSVDKNDSLTDWTVSFDTSKSGQIVFEAKSDKASGGETVLFSIKFVIFNESITSSKITLDNAYTSVYETETYVTNQEEIDQITHDKETAMNPDDYVIPDPIYGERTVEKQVPLTGSEFTLQISSSVSNNAYLKSVEFKNGEISPAFNKLTNSYKVKLPAGAKAEVTALPESEDSVVDISDEINEQIIITVKAADDTMNSYIFNIQREEVKKDPVDPSGNSGSGVLDKKAKITMIALSAGALAVIILGSYCIYAGSRVDEE